MAPKSDVQDTFWDQSLLHCDKMVLMDIWIWYCLYYEYVNNRFKLELVPSSEPWWPQVTYLDPTAKLNVMLNIFVGVSLSWGTYAGWFCRPGNSSRRLLFTFIALKMLAADCSNWLLEFEKTLGTETVISTQSFIHSFTFIMFILFVSFVRIGLPRTIQR